MKHLVPATLLLRSHQGPHQFDDGIDNSVTKYWSWWPARVPLSLPLNDVSKADVTPNERGPFPQADQQIVATADQVQ